LASGKFEVLNGPVKGIPPSTMTRSRKINPKLNYEKTWDYPHSREYCTHCGHRHCGGPITIDGIKSKKKSKGTHKEKRFSKTVYDINDFIFF
jgi:hypothetical protein